MDGLVLAHSGPTTQRARDDGKLSARQQLGCCASTTWRPVCRGRGGVILCLATRRLLSIAGPSALAEPARRRVLLLTACIAAPGGGSIKRSCGPGCGGMCRLCRQARLWDVWAPCGALYTAGRRAGGTYGRHAVLCIQACDCAGLCHPHPPERGFCLVSCPSERPSASVWHSRGDQIKGHSRPFLAMGDWAPPVLTPSTHQ